MRAVGIRPLPYCRRKYSFQKLTDLQQEEEKFGQLRIAAHILFLI